MKLPFEIFIASRYLRAKRKQAFISIITLISVAGVAIGVMALILVLGVMTGFTDDLREKILGTNSHVVISRFGAGMSDYKETMDRIAGVKDVVASTPFILSTVNCSYVAAAVVGTVIGANASFKAAFGMASDMQCGETSARRAFTTAWVSTNIVHYWVHWRGFYDC